MTEILIGRNDSASVCLNPRYALVTACRAVGSRLGQQIVRGLLGGIFGGKR